MGQAVIERKPVQKNGISYVNGKPCIYFVRTESHGGILSSKEIWNDSALDIHSNTLYRLVMIIKANKLIGGKLNVIINNTNEFDYDTLCKALKAFGKSLKMLKNIKIHIVDEENIDKL